MVRLLLAPAGRVIWWNADDAHDGLPLSSRRAGCRPMIAE
jgi:hypothetical protein